MTNWDQLSRAEKLAHWAQSEALLADLLARCSAFLTVPQHEVVRDFIEHNEHGLALESLFDYLDREPRGYPAELLDQFRVVAAHVPMSGDRVVESLGR